MDKLIPRCDDCKHYIEDFMNLGHCRKFTIEADPFMWAYGVTRKQLDVHDARRGPCGKEAKGFERRPSLWERFMGTLK